MPHADESHGQSDSFAAVGGTRNTMSVGLRVTRNGTMERGRQASGLSEGKRRSRAREANPTLRVQRGRDTMHRARALSNAAVDSATAVSLKRMPRR